MLITLRQLLDHAAENSYGVPAFNVNNLEQMRAIMQGAAKTDSPVIAQASAGARKYAGIHFLRHLIIAATEEFPQVPLVMHQDHGASPQACQRSIQAGFTSVMMDGSLLDLPCLVCLVLQRDFGLTNNLEEGFHCIKSVGKYSTRARSTLRRIALIQ